MALTDEARHGTGPATIHRYDGADRGQRLGMRLQAYRVLTSLLRPIAGLVLDHRSRRGKEDPARRNERYGIAGKTRPAGTLLWIHAASVGEMNAVLPLISGLRGAGQGVTVLLTTGTKTSAELAASRMPSGVLHQFVPLDAASYVRRFLAHWRPDVAVFVESEIWPNLLIETKRSGATMVLVNARLSDASFARWQRQRESARALFQLFDVVLAQNDVHAARYRALGSPHVDACGNLKVDAPPLPVDAARLAELREALADRPLWLAASTHPGEDEIVIAAHQTIRDRHAHACTIIAPRHPERGRAIRIAAAAAGLKVCLRSAGERPDSSTDIYIADTIGELGTLFALCPVTFVGGSMIAKGGQNPIEPLRHGSAVISGTHVSNFADIFEVLRKRGVVTFVNNEAELAAAVQSLLADASALAGRAVQAGEAIATLSGALAFTTDRLASLLSEADQLRSGGDRATS